MDIRGILSKYELNAKVFSFFASIVLGLLFYHSSYQTNIGLNVAWRIIPFPVLYWLPILIFIASWMLFEKRFNVDDLKWFVFWAFLIQMLDQALGLVTGLALESMKINDIYEIYVKLFIFLFSLFCAVLSLKGDKRFKAMFIFIFVLIAYHAIVGRSFIYLTALPIGYFISRIYKNEFHKTINLKFKKFYSNEKLFLMALISITLLTRLVFGVSLVHQLGNDYILASDDGIGYFPLAEKIANNPKTIFFEAPNYVWPPIYIWFLAGLILLVGKNFYLIVVFNSVVSLIASYFIYLLAKKLFDRSVASIATFLIAVNQPLIFYAAILGTEVLSIPFFCVYLYIIVACFKEANLQKIFLGGIFWGLTCWTIQLHIFLYPLFMVGILIFLEMKMKEKFKKIMVFTIGGAIIFIPFQLNYYFQKNVFKFLAVSASVGNKTVSQSGLLIRKPIYFMGKVEEHINKVFTPLDWKKIQQIRIEDDLEFRDFESKIIKIDSKFLSDDDVVVNLFSKKDLIYQWFYLKKAIENNMQKILFFDYYGESVYPYRTNYLLDMVLKDLAENKIYFSTFGIINYFKLQYYCFKFQPVKWFVANTKLAYGKAKYYFFPSQFGYVDPVFLLNVARLNISKISFWNTLEFYSLIVFVFGLYKLIKLRLGGRGLFLISVPLFFFSALFPSHFIFIHMLRYSTPLRPVFITILALGIFYLYKYLIEGNYKNQVEEIT